MQTLRNWKMWPCIPISMNRLQNCELLVFLRWTFNKCGQQQEEERPDSKTDLNLWSASDIAQGPHSLSSPLRIIVKVQSSKNVRAWIPPSPTAKRGIFGIIFLKGRGGGSLFSNLNVRIVKRWTFVWRPIMLIIKGLKWKINHMISKKGVPKKRGLVNHLGNNPKQSSIFCELTCQRNKLHTMSVFSIEKAPAAWTVRRPLLAEGKKQNVRVCNWRGVTRVVNYVTLSLTC